MSTAQQEAAITFVDDQGRTYEEIIAWYEAKQQREQELEDRVRRETEDRVRRETEDRVRRETEDRVRGTLLQAAQWLGASPDDLRGLRALKSLDELEAAVRAMASSSDR